VRVLMIAANTERINLPTLPLGAALVAAATEADGHEVAFLDLMGEAEPEVAVRRRIQRVQPDVIGISVRNIDDQDMARPIFLLDKVRPVVDACRQVSDAPVVLGGAGFTLFPGPVLAHLGADYGVAGEGEEAFPALLERLEEGGDGAAVPGVFAPGRAPVQPRAAVADLDGLVPAGGELWTAADLEDPSLFVPVQTRRGCPYRCTYCSTPRIEGNLLRSRSPRLVADQLGRMAAEGVGRVQFVDNIFNIPRQYALELCHEIRALEAGLQWMCILYPSGIDDELAAAMADSGCVAASLGFEAGSDRILRSFAKTFDTVEVRRISDLLADHGIVRFGFLLLGGPEETRESVIESLDFVESLSLDMLKITVGIRIYPGTPLAELAVRQGVVSPTDDLLHPRFYMAPGLEEFIRDQVAKRGLAD
jgi:radical SAM superfamily enzyme YgiQ (UPF0313 family)